MRRIHAISGFVLAVFSLRGQNLVPNPSFEDTTSIIPNVLLEMCKTSSCTSYVYCANWFVPTTVTLCYFNKYAGDTANGVPKNFVGYQLAHTGNAYAGCLALYGGKGYLTNQRSYISAKLSSSLISGKNYNVGFYLALADSSEWIANNIGAYLSSDSIHVNSNQYLPFIPQVESPKDSMLNKKSWTLISGKFTAKGGEQYITIGNFYPDSLTVGDSLPHGYYGYGASYLIDDVFVTHDTLESIQNFSYPLSFSVFPNPASTVLTIQTSLSEHPVSITIFNLLGQNVSVSSPPVSSSYSVDVGELPKGVYIIQVLDMKGYLIGRQKVIVQ